MRAFVVVWAGQLVSITGTMLTGFGLQLYVFVETGSVTKLTFVALAYALPAVVLAPLAGSVADRLDRRTVMLVSDVVAAAATLTLLVALAGNSLEFWLIYLATGLSSAANTFQDPAWTASIPVLVPRSQLGRANGMVQLNQGLAIVVAPALAGALLTTVGLAGVLIADIVSFAIGVLTLALVRFPPFTPTGNVDRSVRADSRFAWKYLRERPGLLGMLWIYSGVNFMLSMTNVLIIPLILSFSTESAAGAVLSAAGIGAVVGSVAVGIFGEPKRLVRTIMGGIAVSGVLLALSGTRESLVVIAVPSVLLLLLMPIVNSASQVVWQTKVEEGVQGRVFSLRRMIGQAISPLAIFMAGPLSDRVFEPAMDAGGPLADSVGALIGIGPGRGIGLLYIVAGLATAGLGMVGWSLRHVRNIETELPDVAGRPDADPSAAPESEHAIGN